MTRKALSATALARLDQASPAAANPADEAAVRTIIESVATFADRNEYEALEKLYAAKVLVDYTSLTGGEPQMKSSCTLMTEWAQMLPGFDRTRHAISDVRVAMEGSTAMASANVVADHWLNGQHWQVTGRYDYRLIEDGREWKINFHQLTVTSELGSRDIFGPAAEAARANPDRYILRKQMP